MERDEILIAIAKLQQSNDEILRRLCEFKEDLKDTKDELAEVRKYVYYAGGALSLVSVSWPFVWDWIKSRIGIA